MALICSSAVNQKLAQKQGVSLEEVQQCFANREGNLLEDTREEHKPILQLSGLLLIQTVGGASKWRLCLRGVTSSLRRLTSRTRPKRGFTGSLCNPSQQSQ